MRARGLDAFAEWVPDVAEVAEREAPKLTARVGCDPLSAREIRALIDGVECLLREALAKALCWIEYAGKESRSMTRFSTTLQACFSSSSHFNTVAIAARSGLPETAARTIVLLSYPSFYSANVLLLPEGGGSRYEFTFTLPHLSLDEPLVNAHTIGAALFRCERLVRGWGGQHRTSDRDALLALFAGMDVTEERGGLAMVDALETARSTKL